MHDPALAPTLFITLAFVLLWLAGWIAADPGRLVIDRHPDLDQPLAARLVPSGPLHGPPEPFPAWLLNDLPHGPPAPHVAALSPPWLRPFGTFETPASPVTFPAGRTPWLDDVAADAPGHVSLTCEVDVIDLDAEAEALVAGYRLVMA